jgi:hydrogenase maturation protease
MKAIIGCGNTLLSDDGIGIHVINELKKIKIPANVKLLDSGTKSIELINELEKFEKIIFIDSAKSNGKPGTIYRLTEKDLHVQKNVISLHELKLEHTLALAKNLLGKKFPKIVIFGVEAKSIEFSTKLSKEVKGAVPKLITLILKELRYD